MIAWYATSAPLACNGRHGPPNSVAVLQSTAIRQSWTGEVCGLLLPPLSLLNTSSVSRTPVAAYLALKQRET
jgi:hypothetical protein